MLEIQILLLNGLLSVLNSKWILQWGFSSTGNVIYPISFVTQGIPVTMKLGMGGSFQRSDMGISSYTITGYNFSTVGVFSGMTWIAIGN